ncbi:MAG TPA: ABC transporter substrate-binding protein [bacterium]|nr:ABC transporter substrate-binding protein [bacterium]
MRKTLMIMVVWLIAGAMTTVYGAGVVKIGQLTPLSGNAAAAGEHEKAAGALAVEIINNKHPELSNLPLAATAGLPNLGGAKLEVVVVDHQGNPSVGQTLTLRLINQDHVVAIEGSYHSSVTFAATAVAERYGIPFVVGDSVAANITQRGFKYTFRVTPIAPTFGQNYMEFLNDMKKAGHSVSTVGVVHENTDYGTSVGEEVAKAATSHGYNVVADIAYNASTTDVSAQVLQLKEKNPDVIIFISYTQDTILYMKTMKSLNYKPKMVIGDDAGFNDPSFIPAVGAITQGVISRSAWAVGKPGSTTYRINEMYKKLTGKPMDDPSARCMEAFFVMADAINRAGSTNPDAIRKALVETNMNSSQVMTGYKGVKFDSSGQNELAATYLIQLQGSDYVTVWPTDRALAPVIWPYKGWQ